MILEQEEEVTFLLQEDKTSEIDILLPWYASVGQCIKILRNGKTEKYEFTEQGHWVEI